MRRRLPASILTLAIAVAGCSSSATGSGSSSQRPPARGTLVVHVALFGGPMRPDGQMAMSNSPAVGGAVTVTGPTGRAYTADTDQHGDARFVLPVARYRIVASACPQPHKASVAATRTARVSIQCNIP